MNIPEWLKKFILKSWSESGNKGNFALRFETSDEIDEFIGLFPPNFIMGSTLLNRRVKSNAYMFVEGRNSLDSADAGLNYFKMEGITVVNYSDVKTPSGEY